MAGSGFRSPEGIYSVRSDNVYDGRVNRCLVGREIASSTFTCVGWTSTYRIDGWSSSMAVT
jgi:hypothetical protein